MKLVISILAVSLSLASFSAQADQGIPKSQLSQYIEAASMAVAMLNPTTCHDAQGGSNYDPKFIPDVNGVHGMLLTTYLSEATTGSIAAPDEQPLLTFYTDVYSADGRFMKVVTQIISSSDYKFATAVILKYQVYEDVNTGTLLNPSISKAWVPNGEIDCN